MLPLQQMQLGNPQQPIPPPPPQQTIPNANDLSLAGVLHFLQTEWRRYERERNEWEIERAEMRARIALLEGERRSFENIKIDLLRRVKMMEYALRVERSKQLQQPSGSVPAGKPASVKDEPQGETVPAMKEGSGSNSPHSEDAPLPTNEARLSVGSIPNGAPAATKPTNPSSAKDKDKDRDWAAPNANNLSLGKAPPGRDPRSRARSRDYLKQCLLELSYLTSPQAMNPLPGRPLLNNANGPGGGQGMQGNNNPNQGGMQGGGGLAIPHLPTFGGDGMNGRQKKGIDMGAKDFPLVNGSFSNDRLEKASGLFGNVQSMPGSSSVAGSLLPPGSDGRSGDSITQLITNRGGGDGSGQEDEPTQLTAIFRPDDAGAWREKLRQANEDAMRQQSVLGAAGGVGGGYMSSMSSLGSSGGVSGWDLGMGGEEGVTHDEEEEDGEGLVGDDSGKKWKVRKTLRNHLDAVRAVAFHPKDMILATGGDDLTVKIWRMDAAQLASTSAGRTVELEPQVTLRGHSAPITCLAIAPHRGLVYSASLDSTIRVWTIPPPHHTTYSPYEPMTSRGELVGHTDAVWGLTLLREGSLLVSCGADGMVKVWDVGGVVPGNLRLSWGYGGAGVDVSGSSSESAEIVGATAVEAVKTMLKWVAVGYRDSVVKIFDVESGKEVAALQVDGVDGGPSTQVNAMVSHPAVPLLVVGYEDKNIRIFDLESFQLTHSMLTHLDAVTSLSLDPSGHSLVSASHDNSVRFWDLLGQKQCTQEDTKHREKGEEGVLAVQFHAGLPFMASAGADGLVKIWASS